MQIQYYFVVFPISYKNIFPSQKSAQSAQSVKSVVSWGIKGPECVEEVEDVKDVKDVKDTCRYERYAVGEGIGWMYIKQKSPSCMLRLPL